MITWYKCQRCLYLHLDGQGSMILAQRNIHSFIPYNNPIIQYASAAEGSIYKINLGYKNLYVPTHTHTHTRTRTVRLFIQANRARGTNAATDGGGFLQTKELFRGLLVACVLTLLVYIFSSAGSI